MLNVNLEYLQEVLISYYNITGVMICLYDRDFNKIYGYPETNCAFCHAWRSNREREAKCIRSDNLALEKCSAQKSLMIYRCHLGLTEAVMPICSNGSILGYILIGQLLDIKQRHAVLEAISFSEADASTKLKLAQALDTLTKYDETKITSIAKIAEVCACYLMVHEIINVKESILSREILDYINMHYTEDLSVESICRHFFISRSTFYKIIKQNLPSGINGYIRDLRLSKAKQLLKTSALSISETAKAVGFRDANYFIKVFRNETGVTPYKYSRPETEDFHETH